jgi:hypothetical protein
LRQCKAHEITPNAESAIERTKRLIGEAVSQLKETKQKITERAIASISGLSRSVVNRCREFLDEILAQFTISNPYSKVGQTETLTESEIGLFNDAVAYVEAASDHSLLTEFEALLEVFDRSKWTIFWEFIPIPVRDTILSQLIAIAT